VQKKDFIAIGLTALWFVSYNFLITPDCIDNICPSSWDIFGVSLLTVGLFGGVYLVYRIWGKRIRRMKKIHKAFLIFCVVWAWGTLIGIRNDLSNDFSSLIIVRGILLSLIIPCAMGVILFYQNRRSKKTIKN